jgi:hypothetical protein
MKCPHPNHLFILYLVNDGLRLIQHEQDLLTHKHAQVMQGFKLDDDPGQGDFALHVPVIYKLSLQFLFQFSGKQAPEGHKHNANFLLQECKVFE